MDAEAQEFTDCFNKSKGVGRMLETSRSAARVGSTSTGTHPRFNRITVFPTALFFWKQLLLVNKLLHSSKVLRRHRHPGVVIVPSDPVVQAARFQPKPRLVWVDALLLRWRGVHQECGPPC